MSVSTYQSLVKRLKKEKNDLEKKANQEKQKEIKLKDEILAINRTLTKSSSTSSIRTKERQIETKTKESIKVGNRRVDLEEKIRKKDVELSRAKENLEKAKQQEEEREEKKRRDRELKLAQELSDRLSHTSSLSSESLSDESSISEDSPKTKAPRRGGPVPMPDDKKWAIVEGWLAVQGRVSQKDYCNSKGIGVSTLRKWQIEYYNRFS